MFQNTILCLFIIISFLHTNNARADSNIDGAQAHALYREAMSHLLGIKGQKKASELAFKKFELLAKQGWKTAQHMLGNMYYKGQGTTQDQVKAYLWYSIAAKQDFSIAHEKVIYLRQHLAKRKIQEAELLITEWTTQNRH